MISSQKTKLLTFAQILCFSLLSLNAIPSLGAGEYVGTVTMIKGTVQLLSADGGSPRVLYRDKTYALKKVRVGTKVHHGDIIQSQVEGKLKVVYPNGDHLLVGPNTSYEMTHDTKRGQDKDPGVLNMFYGKVRAVVSQNGPRSGLKVKTTSTVAGVRGTDFFVVDRSHLGTELTVLRGKVEVQKATPSPEQKVEVTSGTSIQVLTDAKIRDLATQPTTQEALAQIQSSSYFGKSGDLQQDVPKDILNEVSALELKAIENTKEDIKKTDPQLFEKLEQAQVSSAEELNTAVVSSLFKQAPREKIERKLNENDFKNLEEDVYKKYFQQ